MDLSGPIWSELGTLVDRCRNSFRILLRLRDQHFWGAGGANHSDLADVVFFTHNCSRWRLVDPDPNPL